MAYNTNFDDTARIEGGKLNVGGTSDGDYGGLALVSRHFIVQQGETSRMRQAEENMHGNWTATQPIPATGFETGPALAVGSETYYLKGTDKPATFVSLTWSQVIEIETV